MQKVALFVFNGDPMCFIHVLLNALDLKSTGYEVRIVIEGAATELLPSLAEADNPLHGLWEKTKGAGLVEGACKACSQKLGTADAAGAQGLPLLEDMNGHPGMSRYLDQGFDIITF
jgi:hypothetical protein